jgi:hypothetical protein
MGVTLLSYQHKRRVFENVALRKIFGPVTKKVKGGWKKK